MQRPKNWFSVSKGNNRCSVSGAQTIQRLNWTAQQELEARTSCSSSVSWQSLEIGTKIKSSWVQPVLNVRWNTLLSRQCTMLIFPLGSALLCEMLNQVLVSAFTKIRAGKQLVPQLIFCDVIAYLPWTLIGRGFCELVFLLLTPGGNVLSIWLVFSMGTSYERLKVVLSKLVLRHRKGCSHTQSEILEDFFKRVLH